MELMFATGNPAKVREVNEICESLQKKYGLELEIIPMPEKIDIPETGSSYRENSLQKADFVWKRYGCNCIADDSGMEVEALNGAPGIYTARYCDHDFAKGIDKLLSELRSLGADTPEKRRASFECCICTIINGKSYSFHGHCPGHIHTEKCGTAGFGFDPVFIADATPGVCMAELDNKTKNNISHRGIAIEEMFRFLAENGETLANG